ncbi:ISL3 family transposase [Telmatocola sphagniphila]|uniref:ISL3 family transposase n=1 Tax=Telmatocola sphagniphila TaxID=1123043 RepID=A0A8E6B9K7_9BACT|nr:ISL3 family transposase [Telmatocola sphagniphila]QVL33902.1 ISL3 family transposase [Telmatocola sphagniphila]
MAGWVLDSREVIRPDPLLRRAKDKVDSLATPRVLGVDDFAFRRGQNYGTILVDLEKHRVLDLLPDREAKTLACWLKAHPQVEIVSRDRATAYAQGIREACPQSIQVTDRWHLLKNLREAIERWFDGKREKIRELIQKSHCEKPSINKELTNQVDAGLSDRQKFRMEQYKQVRRWHEEGLSKRQIHKRTGLHFRTIDRYLRREDCSNWLPGRRGSSRLDVHEGFIKEQLQQPKQTAQKIHQALRTKDCSIGYSVVKACVRRLKTELGLPLSRPSKPFIPNRVPLPSSRSLALNLLQKSETRSEEGTRILEILLSAGSEFQGPIDLTLAFATLLKGKQESAFSEWLQKVEASSVLELKRFAQGLRNDEAAVRAAVTLPWSNGQVEGQVNRLKSIKRAMFGRAKFDLLKARVICNG